MKITNKASFYDKFNDVLNLLNEDENSFKEANIMIYYNDILDVSSESLPSISPPKEDGESTISLSLSMTRDLSDIKSRNYIPKQLIFDKSVSEALTRPTEMSNTYMNNFIINRSDFLKHEDNNRYTILLIRLQLILQNKKFHELKVNELVSNIVTIAKDNNGCRFLQLKMDEMPPLLIQNIFQKTLPHIVELCNDAFGNFFIQKLIELLPKDNILMIINSIQLQFLQIATNPYGTRVIQKLFEIDDADFIKILCRYVNKDLIEYFFNPNSIHILQKIISHLFPFSTFIYNCIYINMINISFDKNGCCILQKCIEHSLDKSRFMIVVLNNLVIYMTDQYANYVLQYLVSLGDQIFINNIVRLIIQNLIIFSKHKFSSNVLEKVKKINFRFLIMVMILIGKF